MKQKAALFVVACAFLLAIVTTGRSQVNSVVTTAKIHRAATSTIWADGSYPLPPPPGSSSSPNLC